jgi:hypothetical protein
MSINPVDNAVVFYGDIKPTATDDSQPAPQQEAVPQIIELAEEEAIIGEDGQKTKGVIRNLMEGHFKGVADVRLRINFHEEIAAMEQVELDQIAGQGLTDIVEYVNSEMETLLQAGDFDEQIQTAIIEAQNTFTSNIPEGSGQLVAGLQAGFDEFVSSLNAVLVPPQESIPGEPEEIAPPIEDTANIIEKTALISSEEIPAPEESTSFDFEQFIGDLVEAFTLKLQELEASLASITVLPELSEPSGKGVAYQKFLDTYNQMRGATELEVQPESVNMIL